MRKHGSQFSGVGKFLYNYGQSPMTRNLLWLIKCSSALLNTIKRCSIRFLINIKSFEKEFACAQTHGSYTFGHKLMHEILQVAIRCDSDQSKLIAMAFKCISCFIEGNNEINLVAGEPFWFTLVNRQCAKSDSSRYDAVPINQMDAD